jgi:hypothetical protein
MTETKNNSRQQDFFTILEEFFERATGKSPDAFATFDSFGEEIRKNSTVLANRVPDAFRYVWDKLPQFYESDKVGAFEEAKKAAGLKFVLGGSSRFGKTHFDSVRKMLLYADTILVPDPILPWMEAPRDDERFQHVLQIQAAFSLLHLKPIVDAEIPYPALIVFPSYEKTLEIRDAKTQGFINNFLVGVLSSKLGREFNEITEIGTFATHKPEEFLRAVESQRLFVGPGCAPGRPLAEQLKEYREAIADWRSVGHQGQIAAYSDSQLVFQGIVERLIPQFHLLENADELNANPMLCIPSQWHYYTTCTTAFEERLRKQGLLEEKTIASARAINQPNLSWLGNIPMKDLVRLREGNENESFRKRLGNLTSQLHKASLQDIEKVTNEVSKDLSALLTEHSKGIRQQAAEFQTKYKIAALGAFATLAAVLVPTLAPFGIPSAAAVALGYAATKIDEVAKRKQQARSLVGVLAAAKTDESSV